MFIPKEYILLKQPATRFLCATFLAGNITMIQWICAPYVLTSPVNLHILLYNITQMPVNRAFQTIMQSSTEINVRDIFDMKNEQNFEFLALKTFQHQAKHCLIYEEYISLRNITVESVENITQIPSLPVEFFKSERIKTGAFSPAKIFASSTTTGAIPSHHHVKDLSIYEQSFLTCFKSVYGDPSDYVILGLLPSYLERPDSSLVYMVEKLILFSKHDESGFFLDNYEALYERLQSLKNLKKRFLLFGVTFALVDFANAFPIDLSGNIVVETGGMKGRQKEITRAELHDLLREKFNLTSVHSEYGMTELLSQGYSKGNGIFFPSDTMRILLREEDDPFAVHDCEMKMITGIINVIDLANIYSCSFIATEDAGKLYPDGSFEVTGRVDHSDIRGCSLMVV